MDNSSTSQSDLTLDAALAAVPTQFRNKLTESYRQLKSAYSNGQHDTCGLRVGRFCETMLRLLQERLTGTHITFGTKIVNFDDECQRLEQTPKTAGPESLRIIMPRGLAFLYTLRNKRGIGHVGGDVDANAIDAATMVRLADWCLCELIRVVHTLSLEEAQAILDAIAERELPEVWSVLGKKRVLDPTLDFRSQTLLLLYSEVDTAVPAEDLFAWTEYSNTSVYRRDVLKKLHSQRLVEYDRETETVKISPTGIAKVEQEILNTNGGVTQRPTLKVRRKKASSK